MNTKDYNACVEQYADALYRYLVRGYSTEEEAKDVVQNVFMKLWIKKDELEFKEVKSYLFVMAKNNAIDLWRREGKVVSMEAHVTPDKQIQHNSFENWDYIQYCLRGLTSNQKTLILLRDYEGYSYEDIADTLGLTLSQVKINLFRARKKVQSSLKKKVKVV